MLYYNIPSFFKLYIVGFRGVPFFYVADRDDEVHFSYNVHMRFDFIYDMDAENFTKCRYNMEVVTNMLNRLKAKDLRFIRRSKVPGLLDISFYDPEYPEDEILHWLDNNATCFTVSGEPSKVIFEE